MWVIRGRRAIYATPKSYELAWDTKEQAEKVLKKMLPAQFGE